MLTKSFQLDTESWDIMMDGKGNIAITANPYAVAQDAACACSTFLGECWYDTTLGIPFYEQILGRWPGTQLINSKLQSEALKLPYVQQAVVSSLISDTTRIASGVMVLTDTNGDEMQIQLS